MLKLENRQKTVPVGYKEGKDGNYYKFYGQRRNWFDAQNICKQDGGQLAIIMDQRTRDVVHSFMEHGWIGLIDKQQKGTWETPTGAITLYRFGRDIRCYLYVTFQPTIPRLQEQLNCNQQKFYYEITIPSILEKNLSACLHVYLMFKSTNHQKIGGIIKALQIFKRSRQS